MTWLNGKPRQTRKIKQPPSSLVGQDSISILDDQILHFLAEDGNTTIWIADLHNASGESDSQEFEKVGVVEKVVAHDVRLVHLAGIPKAVYASVEWVEDESKVVFRVHERNATVLKEVSLPAKSVYRRIVSNDKFISVCTSSGHVPPEEELDEAYEETYSSTRSLHISGSRVGDKIIPDQIALWEVAKDDAYHATILQDPSCPIFHQTGYEFISSDKVALAGQSETSIGIDSGLLKSFSISSASDEPPRTFAQSQQNNKDSIAREVGRYGSSEETGIFVHVHARNRISIFHRDLLIGKVESLPTWTEYNLHATYDHRSHHRSINAQINPHASISGNRVLVVSDPDSEGDAQEEIAQILDFDPKRVESLTKLDAAARGELKDRIAKEDLNSRVQVVTRRYNIDANGEEQDMEFPDLRGPTTEWNDYLTGLYQERLARLNADGDQKVSVPVLEYEEAPEEHRKDALFGFIRTKVQLSQEGIDPSRLAITKSALIYLPKERNDDLVVFDFEE